MNDVGLYRVSAAKSDIQQLKEYFDSNHPDLIRKLDQADIHVITGIVIHLSGLTVVFKQ